MQFKKGKHFIFIFVLLLILVTTLHSKSGKIINIGDRRELFVDYLLIDEMKGVEPELHHPHREGVALAFDKPWEGKFSAYITVLKDGALWHMYYRGLPESGKEGEDKTVTAYAVSTDGIHWTKPELGIYETCGTNANNVILARATPYTHNFCPFIDTCPGIPQAEKFKAIAGNEKTGLVAFVSGDGVHWKKMREAPVFTKGMFDSQNVAFWSQSKKCYVCYFRTWTGEGYTGFRTISRTTSMDFINWTEPVAMDFGGTPMEHLYTNATTPYYRAPHIYISLPKRFFPDKAAFSDDQAKALVDNPKYRIASSDAVLMTSRGGNIYDRMFMDAFIRPGESARDWVARDNTPALGVHQGNDRELFIYRLSHYVQPTCHVTRYSLRIDGFISVSASYKGGELITKPFVFDGSELEINFATSAAGGGRVEIQDQQGKPYEKFSMQKCPEMIGDQIKRVVAWEQGTDVSELAGKPVRLRFWMKDADLYSFKFNKPEK